MAETTKQPQLWWPESHRRRARSSGLQSTLTALDEKAKAMLRLIEEDADSFAQRAEMFYKKRPQLIYMVEDFYRAHRSLAEQYDQVKSDPGSRFGATLSFPFFINKFQYERSACNSDQTEQSDCCSETHDHLESVESDVDDPELEDASRANEEEGREEVKRLREEIEKLREDRRIQEVELAQKDEEKREAIRQLSFAMDVLKGELVQKDEGKREAARQLRFAMDVLKEENFNLRKKQTPIVEFCKLKWDFWRNG